MTSNFEFDRLGASNRLNSFIDYMKEKCGSLERQPGMKKQARENYRNKGTLPSAPILAAWSNLFDLNVNWLLTGEGKMLKDNTSPTIWSSEELDTEERIRELKYTIELQKKLLEGAKQGGEK